MNDCAEFYFEEFEGLSLFEGGKQILLSDLDSKVTLQLYIMDNEQLLVMDVAALRCW